jgi:methionyl aminopeptidase
MQDGPLQTSLPFASAKQLHKVIKEQFGTLVWCRRYLERLGEERYLAGVSDFPTYVAQKRY